MNERIKELAEQAAWKTRMTHNNAYWRMQEELAEDITWREKFAELIVRECMNICTAGTIEKPMGLYYAKQIEKQFGVE